jgi:hypothetical protein
MPHYSLRTLLILMAIGPPMVADGWFLYELYAKVVDELS